jgi:hypothetical protein
MKRLTYNQLKTWNPCNGHDWLGEFKKKYGKSAPMAEIEKELLARKDFSALNWLIGKRLERLNKRQICMFAYRCAHRSLKYARKQDLPVLKKAIGFAKQYADTGKVDRAAAGDAARAAAWAAARAAARDAARDAARAAAWAAARDAAWDAAWDAQLKQIVMVLEELKK